MRLAPQRLLYLHALSPGERGRIRWCGLVGAPKVHAESCSLGAEQNVKLSASAPVPCLPAWLPQGNGLTPYNCKPAPAKWLLL